MSQVEVSVETKPNHFWRRWLVTVTFCLLAFGASMLLAPGFIRSLFGWMLFASPGSIDKFGATAVAYITFMHGVLGAVMVGWSVALLFILFGSFRRGSKEGWVTLTVSILAWFIPDTAFSLLSGFWQNAVLNVGLMILFAIPLGATYRAFHKQ